MLFTSSGGNFIVIVIVIATFSGRAEQSIFRVFKMKNPPRSIRGLIVLFMIEKCEKYEYYVP